MTAFNNTDQLYTCFSAFFEAMLAQDPHASGPIAKSNLNIHFVVQQPSGEIWLNGRSTPVQPHFGTHPHKADLELHLSGDTLHKILLGELWILKALGSKKLTAKGPIHKAKALNGLFEQGKAIYPQIYQETVGA